MTRSDEQIVEHLGDRFTDWATHAIHCQNLRCFTCDDVIHATSQQEWWTWYVRERRREKLVEMHTDECYYSNWPRELECTGRRGVKGDLGYR